MNHIEIDWTRIAEPQTDAYDVEATLAIAGGSVPRFESDVMLCDGLIAVLPKPTPCAAWLSNAHPTHANIARAEALVRRYPAGYTCLGGLISVFYPLEDESRLDHSGGGAYGSTCGSDEQEPHSLYATVYSDLGLAEALVHELGHQKLRRLGIRLESHDRLIGNEPQELYESPVRKDKPRPMSAVVHGQYSYSYVLALDVACYQQEQDEAQRAIIRHALSVNNGRMKEGRATLAAHLVPAGNEGEDFFAGYFAWLDRTIEAADTILNS